jgi:hypothetical protein
MIKGKVVLTTYKCNKLQCRGRQQVGAARDPASARSFGSNGGGRSARRPAPGYTARHGKDRGVGCRGLGCPHCEGKEDVLGCIESE